MNFRFEREEAELDLHKPWLQRERKEKTANQTATGKTTSISHEMRNSIKGGGCDLKSTYYTALLPAPAINKCSNETRLRDCFLICTSN